MPTVEWLHAVGGLLLEGCFYFLWNHSAAEDPGEDVTDCALELSLEPLDNAHGGLSSRCPCHERVSSRGSRPQHDIRCD